MTKVLLDTDIGSDIDDALCLAYLLAHPECELTAITTVSGQARERAMLASALCRRAGQDVPIAVGADSPLLIPQGQPEAQQAAALGDWPHDTGFPGGAAPALDLMRQTIRANPGEVVLLTIGPLTNVALLFAIDPGIPQLLKGVVSMAGSFWRGIHDGCEWNIVLDPHAAAMVYRARPPWHRSVGLDVTTRVTLDAPEFRERLQQSPLLQPVLDWAEVWFTQRDTVVFHDPLAAAALFDDRICTFEQGAVTIEINDLDSERQLGVTRWSPGAGDTQQEVATEVNADRFLTHYFGILK